MVKKIIAEIGFNHEGKIETAKKMIRAAAKAGADCVKFQTYRASDIALPSSPHFNAIAKGEMGLEEHKILFNEAMQCGVEFMSTPFSPWAVDLLEKIGVKAYKVASMDCTNKMLLSSIAQTGKPIYLSTGMATVAEIADSLAYLETFPTRDITLMHCLSLYPAEADALHLSIIRRLKELFNVPVGYSDHYPGVKACLVAVMWGAEVIETHFTLDTSMSDGDHAHSADAVLLRSLVDDIRLFERMSGDDKALFNRPDRKMASTYRRGVYATRDLSAGTKLTREDILFCRPETEITPSDMLCFEGKTIPCAIKAHHPIRI